MSTELMSHKFLILCSAVASSGHLVYPLSLHRPSPTRRLIGNEQIIANGVERTMYTQRVHDVTDMRKLGIAGERCRISSGAFFSAVQPYEHACHVRGKRARALWSLRRDYNSRSNIPSPSGMLAVFMVAS